ncbi:hypothetical protein Tco_0691031 [Tanacetum coccineum]
MAEIMKTISLVPRVDRYIWSLENDGSFSVASIRKTLDDNRFQGGEFVDKVGQIRAYQGYEKDFFMVECGVYGG